MSEKIDRELSEFLDGIVGVVEATDCERHFLWMENGGMGTPKLKWEEISLGLVETVGYLDNMPTCISLFKARIDGHLLLFWHPTSQVVDHRLIDIWMVESIPESARRSDGYINKTDAMNFHNVLPHRQVAERLSRA